MIIFEGEKKEFCIRQQALLEASAGTGKTYAIQTLYLRLLLEEGLTPDTILVVTFTRLSTEELKYRLRKAIKELILKIDQENRPEYVKMREKKGALRWLKGSLALMEKSKIFTIHGFCSYLLQKFRFDPVSEDSLTTQEKVVLLVKDALRLLPKDQVIALWQKEILLNALSIDTLVVDFAELCLKKKVIHALPGYPEQKKGILDLIAKIKREYCVEADKLLQDLEVVCANYKSTHDKAGIKATFMEELKRFCALFTKEQSMQFEELFYLEEENAKKRQEVFSLSYPGLLQVLQQEVFPFLKKMQDSLEIFATLGVWIQEQVRARMEKEALYSYEDLLLQARQLLQDPVIKKKVQEEFQAVLIDEFQDTDALQWEIFSSLFLGTSPFYVVGDPKQSIYRFRHADLYTYFLAKNSFSNCYSLETNYRTAPRLMVALNELFSKVPNFLDLPQMKKSYPCPPVNYVPKENDDSELIFWKVESEEQLFLLIQKELKKIQEKQEKLFHSAILVKDYYQLKRLEKSLDPTLCFYSENREPLEKTKSFFYLELLIDALVHPQDREKLQRLYLSSFFKNFERELFSVLYEKFQKKGLLAAFRVYLENSTYLEERDLMMMLELIAEIEKRAPSITQLLKTLHSLKEEPLKFTAQPAKDGIRIMTIHMSKGLEFDYLFPIALIAPFSQKKELFFDSFHHHLCIKREQDLEEKTAEKMRLFYVAMTRAKKKIFLPIPVAQKIEAKKSILQTFMERRFIDETLEEFVASTPHVELQDFINKEIEHTSFSSSRENAFCSKPFPYSFFSPQITSFSAQGEPMHLEPKKTEPLFPSGKQVGTILHSFLEKKPFSLSYLQWQKILEKEIDPSLQEHKEPIAQLFYQATHLLLKSDFATFTLSQLEEASQLREIVFCMIDDFVGIQGIIDLIFLYEGRYYLLDYKSNHLDSYTKEAMTKEIECCRYFEQGALYQNALQKALKHFDDSPFEEIYGGFFYLFLRGPSVVYVRKF